MFTLELQNCGKSFNRRWLFRNLNLTFKTGESWAVTGKNGAGKSTFLLMLSSQLMPTEGKIIRTSDYNTVALEQAFAYSSLASPAMELPDEFSANDLFRLQKKLKPFRINHAEDEFAALCGYDRLTMNKAIGYFSSGMKQRLKLALAVFCDTPLLFLDEPLTNLDNSGELFYARLIENYTHNRLVVVAGNRQDEFGFCQHSVEISTPLSGF